MLRIVVFIQCDLCNAFLSEIATGGDPREESAESPGESFHADLHELRLIAEERGWQSLKDSTVHHCSSCTSLK